MAEKNYKVADLGSKLGSAVNVFNRDVAKSFFADVGRVSGDQALAIDRLPRYEPKLRAKGFDVWVGDVVELLRKPELPFAVDVFLAGNFLEHLADIAEAQWVLRRMLEEARLGVWLWMPSFEQDMTGEGQLKRRGLQFSWTSWKGHTAHLCLKHVREVLAAWGVPHERKIYPSIYLRDSRYRMVVPLRDWGDEEPINYDSKRHGPKPILRFDPPVVREWGVQVRRVEGG